MNAEEWTSEWVLIRGRNISFKDASTKFNAKATAITLT
jgi:hypothetical protein